MSYGCEGCFQSARGMQEQLEIVKTKAKAYAVEKEKTVAIYREGYEFRFCEHAVAIEQGYLIAEILSQYH